MKVKPCPFCKRKQTKLTETTTEKFRYCLECGACGPKAGNEEEANELWNNRKPRVFN